MSVDKSSFGDSRCGVWQKRSTYRLYTGRKEFQACRRNQSASKRCRSKRIYANFLWNEDDLPVTVDNFEAPKGSTLKNHRSSDGRWHVRPAKKDELPLVAEIQAEGFYDRMAILGPFNKALLYSFQAEVYSGLRTKITYAARDGFQCLVAEDAQDPGTLVGVVEVSLQSGKDELATMQDQGFEELMYAYVACMTVVPEYRRNGIASELLKAAEIQAGRWGQNWVLLHVYIDNAAGINLYKDNGYTEIASDPEWQKYLGRRRRYLLAKQATVTGPAGAVLSISQNLNKLKGMWNREGS